MGKGKPSRWHVWHFSDLFHIIRYLECDIRVCSHGTLSAERSKNLPWSQPQKFASFGWKPTGLFEAKKTETGPFWSKGAGNFSDPFAFFAFGRLTSALKTVPSKDVIFRKFRVFTSDGKLFQTDQTDPIGSIRFDTQTVSSAPWTTCYAS